jgi:peptidoglycan/xylan/chitin deacetylase (PgdA/CDA1 family)
MKRVLSVISFVALFASGAVAAQAADCADDPRTTGLSRTIAINAQGGGLYGRLQYKQTAPLRDKEVVITFDDGPHASNTKTILDALDRHCVKATFFAVGRMALYHKKTLKEIARRGHTIGSHTFAHPKSAAKLPFEDAKVEIEKGFVATSQALGAPIAPFFRFPGLNDSKELNAYLSSRNISVWSVDVVSGDTYPGVTPEKLVRSAMERLRRMKRGIVLFHDLKQVTADSLDLFLTQLELEGFKVVHVVSNSSYKADPVLMARLDMSKRALERTKFTGLALEGDVLPGQDNLMNAGEVDILKTEFIHIESSASSGSPKKQDIKPSAPAANAQEYRMNLESDNIPLPEMTPYHGMEATPTNTSGTVRSSFQFQEQ